MENQNQKDIERYNRSIDDARTELMALYLSHKIIEKSSAGNKCISVRVYMIADDLIRDFGAETGKEIFRRACLIFRDVRCSRWLTEKKKDELKELMDLLGQVYRYIESK